MHKAYNDSHTWDFMLYSGNFLSIFIVYRFKRIWIDMHNARYAVLSFQRCVLRFVVFFEEECVLLMFTL